MARRLLVAVFLALMVGGVDSSAQSLADVARAEAARRKALGDTHSKTYTNDDLRGGDTSPESPDAAAAEPSAAQPPTTPSSSAAAPAGGAAAASPAPAAAPDASAAQPPQPAAEPPKDEKYWRNRIAAARDALQRSKAFYDALQSHINGLWAEFTAMGDPYQRAAVEKKRFEAIAEQDRVKADIEKQTKEIAAIEEEARRASVPAGWLR
jgi:hypothetical protein